MIDIVIPTYEGAEVLKPCLLSLKHNTTEGAKIVIADDHSKSSRMREILKGQNVILNGSGTQGFPHNVNWTVNQLDSEFICLLNSDTEVTRGWLSFMMEEMTQPSVGVVGCKLVYPPSRPTMGGLVQHAGVATNRQGLPYHIYRGYDPLAPEVNRRLEINCVTFACALIRRDCWEDIGGLDERYVGGQFEDVHFCREARDAGWRVVYTPRALVYHVEHGSGEEFAFKSGTPNRNKLVKAWPNYPSDEGLFEFSWKHLWQPQHFEGLAAVCHKQRQRDADRTARNGNLGDYLMEQQVLAVQPYDKVSPKQREEARAMAKSVLHYLQSLEGA